MNGCTKAFATIAVCCALAACSAVPTVPSKPEVLARIQTVAVIRPPATKTYTVLYIGHPGTGFGLIGGLIAAGDMSSKQDRLTEALNKEKLSVPSGLAENIAERLSQQGFQATVEDGPWEAKDGNSKLDFDKIQSSADAVLVILPTVVGFVATHLGSDYFPTVMVVATLLDKDRKTQLYRGYHASGWEQKREGWKYTPADTSFANFNALMLEPAKTADSLVDAANAVSITIAGDLVK
jgi:hypothetical protein